MSRPAARIEPMLALLRAVWERHPDQRLGQLIGNAARGETTPAAPFGEYRDPFNVEDHEVWEGLRRLAHSDSGADG